MTGGSAGGEDEQQDPPASQWPSYPKDTPAGDATGGPQDPDPPEVLLRKAEQRAREAEQRARRAEEQARAAEAKAERETRAAEAKAERKARLARYDAANLQREVNRQRSRKRRKQYAGRSQQPERLYVPWNRLVRSLKIGAGGLVLAIVVALVLIGVFGDSGSRSGRDGTFARPSSPTPTATERALRAGTPLTLVTGTSRSVFVPDGSGRVAAGPSSRTGSWQIGVADLRSEKVLWTVAVVPGANARSYGYGTLSMSGQQLLEPGRMVQGPESNSWSLLESDTGEVLRTAPQASTGSAARSREDTLAALAGDQLLVAQRTDSRIANGCSRYAVRAYQDTVSEQPRWTAGFETRSGLSFRAVTDHGLLWLSTDTEVTSSYGPGPMINLYEVALDPATGQPPAWYREPTGCDDTVVGYLPVDGQHVLRVSEPESVSREERWDKRRYELLDATGNSLWKTSDPLMAFDGQVYRLGAPKSYTAYVASDSRLLDVRTGKPMWQQAVPGHPVAVAGDKLLLKGYPGITVAARADGAVRSTTAVGRDGSAVAAGDSYYILAPGSLETAVSAYAISDGSPLWTQNYPVQDAQLLTSGDQLALVGPSSGTVLPLKPPG